MQTRALPLGYGAMLECFNIIANVLHFVKGLFRIFPKVLFLYILCSRFCHGYRTRKRGAAFAFVDASRYGNTLFLSDFLLYYKSGGALCLSASCTQLFAVTASFNSSGCLFSISICPSRLQRSQSCFAISSRDTPSLKISESITGLSTM